MAARAGSEMGERLGPYLLGPTDDENQGVYTGDAREFAQAIPNESIDLIFTDPVYQQIDDYRWLAETAARVLKPDSSCLAFCGIGYIPEVHDAMRSNGLAYRWRLVVRPLFGKGSGQWHGRLQAGTKEIVWYEKGRARLYNSIFDLLNVSHNEYGKCKVNGATWGKALSVVWWYVNAFSQPGSIVADFFAGEGSIIAASKLLGRRWLAFEIKPDTAEAARQRIRQTQPPLFTLEQPRQLRMEAI